MKEKAKCPYCNKRIKGTLSINQKCKPEEAVALGVVLSKFKLKVVFEKVKEK